MNMIRKKKVKIIMFLSLQNRLPLFSGALIILGVLIILTPWYIFPVCEAQGITSHAMSAAPMGTGHGASMNPGTGALMKCGYAARAEAASGALVILTGLTLFALRNRDSRRASGIFSIGLGAVTILIPTVLIGVCASADAPCRIGTFPAWILLGILTIVAGILLVLARDQPSTPAN